MRTSDWFQSHKGTFVTANDQTVYNVALLCERNQTPISPLFQWPHGALIVYQLFITKLLNCVDNLVFVLYGKLNLR